MHEETWYFHHGGNPEEYEFMNIILLWLHKNIEPNIRGKFDDEDGYSDSLKRRWFRGKTILWKAECKNGDYFKVMIDEQYAPFFIMRFI